jgi:mannan endo-1,4-beta-mannosidase
VFNVLAAVILSEAKDLRFDRLRLECETTTSTGGNPENLLCDSLPCRTENDPAIIHPQLDGAEIVRITFGLLVFALILMSGLHAQQAATEPVNPHATPEARALLAYVNSISGRGIIAGQHNYPNDGARWTDLAYDLTGKYPGLFGGDFGFSSGEDKDSVLARPAMIAEAERQYKNGAVITLTWHMVRPTDDEPVTFHDSVQGKLTDYEWQELLTPGTPLNNRWCAQVDVVAGYLRQLRDAHVPVLFRPFHEVNGSWFWWGGRPGKDGSQALYRQLYDRYVNLHHLDNLVWVWNVNAPNPGWPPIAVYYPGAQYADLLTMDIYGEFKQEYYDSMLALAAGKPIALGEVGTAPSPEVLARQPRWTYFMVWSELVRALNTEEGLKATYNAPPTLTRNDPRLAGPMEAIRRLSASAPEAEPVSPGASTEAKVLLARLQAVAENHQTLSGEMEGFQSLGKRIVAAAKANGRGPAIHAAELEEEEGAEGVKEDALVAHQHSAIIYLSWLPERPTDGAPQGHGQLTDYEWRQLLTPGTSLNVSWLEQIDSAATSLRDLEKAGVAVLWSPLPESNSKNFWWAGRKGVHGSAELYRQLFDRLVNKDGLHNLVWIWEADAPSSASDSAGAYSDYFPGLLYTDALELSVHDLNGWSMPDKALAQFATGKPIGVEITGDLPSPEALLKRSAWNWFLTQPSSTAPAQIEAYHKIYNDPHVVSIPVQ